MAPVRLRHPKGVSTIQLPFDRDDYTVQDLQQAIYAASDILPSRQSLKSGYPPRALTIVPELPVSSLGLTAGEQIIVSELADTSRPTADKPSASSPFVNPVGSAPASSAPRASAPATLSSPSRASAPAPGPTTSDGPDAVETDGAFLVHRIVPDDNSCLFTSVALVFEQDPSPEKAQKMREIVVAGIRADPETYSEAILNMSPAAYIAKILQPSTWGGAIELGILAAHFRTEIASVDVETGRIDQFLPGGQDTENRCLLIYSGIHYDAASLAPMADAPGEWHQTVFPTRNADVLNAAKRLAEVLRAKRKFTNTATFDLKCEQCGKGIKGEKGAQTHAAETGHTRFGEY